MSTYRLTPETPWRRALVSACRQTVRQHVEFEPGVYELDEPLDIRFDVGTVPDLVGLGDVTLRWTGPERPDEAMLTVRGDGRHLTLANLTLDCRGLIGGLHAEMWRYDSTIDRLRVDRAAGVAVALHNCWGGRLTRCWCQGCAGVQLEGHQLHTTLVDGLTILDARPGAARDAVYLAGTQLTVRRVRMEGASRCGPGGALLHLYAGEQLDLAGVYLEHVNDPPVDGSVGVRAEVCHNATIRDVRLRQDRGGTLTTLVEVRNSHDVTVADCTARGAKTAVGRLVSAEHACRDVAIERCQDYSAGTELPGAKTADAGGGA